MPCIIGWLSVSFWVQFKVLIIPFKALYGRKPGLFPGPPLPVPLDQRG